MASPRPLPTEEPSAGGGDEFDDLFDYEIGGEDDPFSESYKAPNKAPAAKDAASKGKSGAGLGIDEEVEVARKPRAPRVKLDENRFATMVHCSNYADTSKITFSSRHPKVTEKSQGTSQIQRKRT